MKNETIKSLGNTFLNKFIEKGKPDWDTYFLWMAKLVSTRSIDPSTKHGCIIVDNFNRILSTGYNGPIKHVDDSHIPIERPDKYYYFAHSEENAIIFCQSSMYASKVYITGRPCARCTRMMIQKDVSKIIHGNVESKCINEDDLKASTIMLKMSYTDIIKYDIY